MEFARAASLSPKGGVPLALIQDGGQFLAAVPLVEPREAGVHRRCSCHRPRPPPRRPFA